MSSSGAIIDQVSTGLHVSGIGGGFVERFLAWPVGFTMTQLGSNGLSA